MKRTQQLASASAFVLAFILASPALADGTPECNTAGTNSVECGVTSSLGAGYSTNGMIAGNGSTAFGLSVTAVGADAVATDSGFGTGGFAEFFAPPMQGGATAVGAFAISSGLGTVAIGDQASVGIATFTGTGDMSLRATDFGTAIGSHSSVTGNSSTALGYGSNALGTYSTVLGANASDGGFGNSVVLGAYTTATASNQVQVGGRTVGGVADGVLTDDAATIGQVQAADALLQANIDAEATARASADATLQSNVDAEATARGSADASLQANIDAEASARASADTAQQMQIDTNTTDIAALQTDVGTLQADVATLQGDVGVLQTDVTGLQANDAAQDTAIADLQAGDAALQGDIDAEAAARIAADSALQGDIDAEVAARNSADTALQGNIDAEASARIAADTQHTADIATIDGQLNGNSIAFGSGSTATVNAVAIGVDQTATGNGAVAIGDPNTAVGTGAVAIGADNTATGNGAVAIGNNSQALSEGAVAIGDAALANGANGVAVGNGASNAGFANSVAVGNGSVNTAANQIAFGGRTLSGVAAGVATTDAVNVGQMNAAIAGINSGLAGMQGDIDTLFDRSEDNHRDIGKANEGVAMALALDSPSVPAGASFAISGGVGGYQGKHALAMAISAAVGEMSAVSAGVGIGANTGEVGYRAGFQFAW